jgi:hypothetical protein
LRLLSQTASANLKEPADNAYDGLAGDGKERIFIASRAGMCNTPEPLSILFFEVLAGLDRLSYRP